MEMLPTVIDHNSFDIEESKAVEIQQFFKPYLDNIQENMPIVDDIEKSFQENPLDRSVAKKAKEVRSQFVKFRTGAAKLHTTLKKRALDYGRYVDAWKNLQNKKCEEIENRLKEIEQYEENLRKAEIDELHRKRSLEIAKYTNDIPPQLGEMTESMYQMILDGVIKIYNDAVEAKRIADEAEKNRQIKLAEEKRQMELDRQELEKQRKDMLAKQEEANRQIREIELEKQRIKDAADKVEREKLALAELELGKNDKQIWSDLLSDLANLIQKYDNRFKSKPKQQSWSIVKSYLLNIK